MGKRLTEREREHILALYDDGLTFAETARQTGRDQHVVRRLVSERYQSHAQEATTHDNDDPNDV